MQRIIAIANRKGGVGKTTTAINLASGLALSGKGKFRVLLIDMDPQANATFTWLATRDPEISTYQFLMVDELDSKDVIAPTKQVNLDIMPSHDDLAGAEVDLPKEIDGRIRLRKRIEAHVTNSYDYIIIDTPPSLGFLTVNSLSAATEVIVPVSPSIHGLQGLAKLQKIIQDIQTYLNRPQLRISGVLRTFYERTNVSRDTTMMLSDFFGDTLFDTIIPKNVSLEEAHSYNESIFSYARTSNGAAAYAKLVEEVRNGG